MASVISSLKFCSSCRKQQSLTCFLRNEERNQYYKTCSDCRSKKNHRRLNLRRQQSVPALQVEHEENISFNEITPLRNNERTNDNLTSNVIISCYENNNSVPDVISVPNLLNGISNTSNFIHCKGCKKNCAPEFFTDHARGKTFKQCEDCRQRSYTRRHPQSLYNGPDPLRLPSTTIPVNAQSDTTINVITEIATMFCRMCKKNCAPESFAHENSISPYSTCLDCRTRDRARRFPTVFEPIPTQRPSGNLEDIDDVNDEEVELLAANIGMFEIVEEDVFNGPVPEEAALGDDPIYMLSQIQSREFRNHDEIQRRLQAEEEANGFNNPDEAPQVDDSNIDPFLEELPPPEIGNDDHGENLILNDPFVEENTHPQINEIVQSQSLLQIDPFLESNPPPQAEELISINNNQQPAEIGEVIEAPPRRINDGGTRFGGNEQYLSVLQGLTF
ncbi:hypothetical protein EV44_g3307 [Erysiphe necator]|uniref:Uncharacterized protein n=1 Tax=Uncinula necator TaxID=52586 RepID=A0A0B1PED2_UNCNE|nr:hypothetical protein EV44_g3307 [Erysiphe necator]